MIETSYNPPQPTSKPTIQVLITRPRKEAAKFARRVRAAGFEPVFFPTITIRPIEDTTALQRALAKLDYYDWVVFTSVNAVNAVFTLIPSPLGQAEPERSKDGVRIAAIGTKTAAALQARGVIPDLVPETHTAEALVAAMGDLRGRWVLFPSADIARETLPEGVVQAGGVAHQIVVYRTLPAEPDPEGLAALHAGVDWLTFTSPSTAQNFVALVRETGLDPFNLPGAPKVACIGPTTAAAARNLGFHVDAVAKPHTTEGLLNAIRDSRPPTNQFNQFNQFNQ